MERKNDKFKLGYCSVMCLSLLACSHNPDKAYLSHHAAVTQTTSPASTEIVKTVKADPFALYTAKQFFVEKKYEQAFKALLPLAEQGDADAQYGIGYLYYYGKGINADRNAGIDWIKQSAHQGFASAVQALKLLNVEDNITTTATTSETKTAPTSTTLISEGDAPAADANQPADATNPPATATDAKPAQMTPTTTDTVATTTSATTTDVIASNTTEIMDANDDDYLAEEDSVFYKQQQQAEQALDTNAGLTEITLADASTDANTAAGTETPPAAPAPETTPEPAKLSHTAKTYGPTKATDTLWSIAKTVRPSQSVPVYDMMMAILRNNPDAFLSSADVNSLKLNSMLKIPDVAEINTNTKTR